MSGKPNNPPAKSKAPKTVDKPKLREPTAGEREAMDLAAASLAKRPRRVEITQELEGTTLKVGQPHSAGTDWSKHLTDTFGTASQPFASQSMVRLSTAIKDRGAPIPTEEQANAALALMAAIAPGDELEAAIGEQIIATHAASLDFLARARANAGEYRDSAAAYTNMATKVSRTMAAHIETLARLRSGGKQTHEVRYVYVNGPAVFGDHAQTVIAGGDRGGGGSTIVGQPHATVALAHLEAATGLPMRRPDPEGEALPLAGREGPEAVPDARRQ